MSAAINLLPLDPAWDPQAPIEFQLARAREAFDVAIVHLNAVRFPIIPGMLETVSEYQLSSCVKSTMHCWILR